MQELEKILEEIESKEFTNMTIRHSMVVKMKDVRSIIRKHMNEKVTTNDLISRKTLMKKFKADCRYSKGYIERCIDESPTAYDVDVVCKELDKASDYYETEEQGKEHVQMVNLTAAIEIVRNGGKYD